MDTLSNIDLINQINKFQIIDVANKYAWILDSHRWEDLNQVFSNDAVLILSNEKYTGIDSIRNFLEISHIDLLSQHILSNFSIRIDNNLALARYYVNAQHKNNNELENYKKRFNIIGYYNNKLSLIDDQWKITYKELKVFWTDSMKNGMY